MQYVEMVFRKRVLDFKLLLLWKSIYYLQKELNFIDATPSNVVFDARINRAGLHFIKRCNNLGSLLQSQIQRNHEVLENWDPDQRVQFINLLLTRISQLLPLTAALRTKFTLEMTSCILRYLGVYFHNKLTFKRALTTYGPSIENLPHSDQVVILNFLDDSADNFSTWFEFGIGESFTEITKVDEFRDKNLEKDQEYAKALIHHLANLR